MRRFSSTLMLLFLASPAMAGCAGHGGAPPAAGDPAAAALRYSATMRSGTGDQLRQSSCGAYAVVYQDITDDKLRRLRVSTTHRRGTFNGSTVVRADQRGNSAEVTLADTYLRDGVPTTGTKYTFVMRADSGDWKVCDTKRE